MGDAVDRPRQIGVFLPNWVGDVVMATPTLRALRALVGPQGRLVGVMKPYLAEVLEGTPWLDDFIWYDRRSKDRQFNSQGLLRRLREMQLDTAVMLTNSLGTAYHVWRSGIPRRVGYARYGRGPLLTDRLQAPRTGWKWQPTSAVDYYLELASALNAPTSNRQTELATSAADEQLVTSLWHRLGWHDGRPVVALNTGGAYGAAKRWPEEYFTELAVRLVRQRDAHVMVLCGPAERESAMNIVAQAGLLSRVASLAHESMSLGLSKAVLRRVQALVSTDSGPRHMGAAFGVPTVALFGSTDPRWSYNYHPQTIELQRHVPCGPCAKRICPLGHHRCMRELTVDHVLQATSSLLAATARTKAA